MMISEVKRPWKRWGSGKGKREKGKGHRVKAHARLLLLLLGTLSTYKCVSDLSAVFLYGIRSTDVHYGL